MAKKIALLFAGQGAQSVGMGRELAENFPPAANLCAQADEILGRSLTDIMWNGPDETLTTTSNCQPALYVHSLAALAVIRELFANFPIDCAAGLSLGEVTAHAAAGTFDFASGLKLVQKRGEFMDEACAATLGGMAAMIGGQENDVRRLAADEDVDIANINSPGQIVISGELAKVEAAVGEALLDVEMQLPQFPVISNVTGEEADTLPEIRRTLQEQVTATVRWYDCMQRMLARGCEVFIELGPGNVLAGLLLRAQRDLTVISVGDADSAHRCTTQMRALLA